MTIRSDPSARLGEALAAARRVLALESQAIASLESRLDARFERAVELLGACRGRVLTSGVGKSGLVAARIAATLTSTGTPALFLHPVEALHGDLGVVSREDVAVLISKSGASGELEAIIPTLKLLGLPIVALVSREDSSLAGLSDVALGIGSPEEGCPFDLVPTTSTAAMQAMGDALAMAVLTLKGFRREDFTFFHPGGAIGRSGMLRVRDVMHSGDELPLVAGHVPLREALRTILDKRLGLAVVTDEAGLLQGILTDGDFKRILLRESDPLSRPVGALATANPRCIEPDAWLTEAVRQMEENPSGPITSLVVTGADRTVLGVVHLHDCLRAGLGR